MTRTVRPYFLPCVLASGLLVVGLRGGSYDDLARAEAFFVVWWLLGLGFAFGLLPHVVPSRAARWAVAALVALAGWTALGVLWTESVGRTVHEASRTLGFAGLLLLVVCTFGRDTCWRAAAAVTGAAIVICCLAFASRLTPLNGALAESGYVPQRLSYPFNYWNAVGVWAAMTVGLALAWSAHSRRWWLRAAALAGICVAIPVAYLTYSRSAAVGVAIAVATVIVLSRHRWLAALHAALAGTGSAAVILVLRSQPEIARGSGQAGAGWVLLALGGAVLGCAIGAFAGYAGGVERVRLAPRLTRWLAASVGVIAVVAAIAFLPTVAARAWDSFHARQDGPATTDPAHRLTNLQGGRRYLWEVALLAFRRHPMQGEGAGSYEFVWNRDERWSQHARDAHSLYLEALAETGLPGALLVVVALGVSLVAAVIAPFRHPAAASTGAAAGCAAALLVFCVTAGVDWMWESTAVTAAAIVCAGLALAAGSRQTSRPRMLPRVAGSLLAVIALVLQTPALLAVSQVRVSQEAIRDRRGEDALVAATEAVHAEPWSADGVSQRALVLEQMGFLDGAADDARRATELEPTNADAWLVLARIEVERRHTRQAIAAASKARQLNPRNPLFNPAGGS
jgi:hypothetical protein